MKIFELMAAELVILGVFTETVVMGANSEVAPDSIVSQDSATDLQAMFEALSATQPIPFKSIPKKQNYIAYWSYQNPQWQHTLKNLKL